MTQQDVLTAGKGPRGETEVTVESVFAQMLGLSGVPRTVSLFDLGLDSVSVTVACARLEQATGVRVRFSQLFRTPTVAQLAAWIDAALDKLNAVPGIAATPSAGGSAALVAITPMQADTVETDIVVRMAWWFDGEIDDGALESAASDIHRRHQALHARYLAGSDLGLAEVPADPGQARFHRLGEEDSDTAASDVLWRTLRQPLRLGEGNVWRCAIVRSRQSGQTLFGVAAHHAAFDGHSVDILTAELSAAYSAHVAGTMPHWPARVASLAEMAADYRHQLAAADAEAQRQYWRDELRDLAECHLPGRNDASAAAVGPAAKRSFMIPNAQLRVWEDYSRANGMSASVAIAAAYLQAVVRAGGPRDVVLNVGIANRTSDIIDRTITTRVGNIYPRPNGPFQSGPHLLARMRDSYHQAMAARDILLDEKEVDGLYSRIQSQPHMVYGSTPALSLGGVDGTFMNEPHDRNRSWLELVLSVVPVSEGLEMQMIVRTDRYEASLAGRLSQHIIDIISDGPDRLEIETAR